MKTKERREERSDRRIIFFSQEATKTIGKNQTYN